MSTAQRKRGVSFRIHYCNSSDVSYELNAAEESLVSFRRTPSLTDVGQFLIPPKLDADKDKLTVVLDLDETLVYARMGPLYVRPGMEQLMTFLAEHCEAVVWTASMHLYADAVVDQIDPCGAIRHTIYRHQRWFNGQSATKELQLLGRDLDSTIIIENTPDCLLGYEQNGVIVEDYEGGELEDTTLTRLLDFIKDLVAQRASDGITVPEFIRNSHHLRLGELPSNKGSSLKCYCLKSADEASVSEAMHRKRKPFNPLKPSTLSHDQRTVKHILDRKEGKSLQNWRHKGRIMIH
ncbi:unnamed protein product [Phytomonas sp. EM1]|nr:unnamed protein product [Phytomonas sp. EM1]|eukprot:CCW63204.1 unnamed protein product [Phytomonas sp. isolate EM1]